MRPIFFLQYYLIKKSKLQGLSLACNVQLSSSAAQTIEKIRTKVEPEAAESRCASSISTIGPALVKSEHQTLRNPRPVGGGAKSAPPPHHVFDHSSQTAARSAAKFCIPLRASIPHTLVKKIDRGPDRSAVSDVRVTSCFADFDQKQGFAGIAVTDTGFKIESNVLYEKYLELMWLSNCYLGILKILKILKIFKNFKIFKKFPRNFQNFQKNGIYVKQLCLMNTCKNFMSISPKMTELERFTCRKQALFTSFLQFSIIFDFLFFCPILIIQKVFQGHFSCSTRKSDLKTCIATSITRNFWFDLFDLVTSDDLDLKFLRMVP